MSEAHTQGLGLVPLATATVTIVLDTLPGNCVGVGVYTEGQAKSEEAADCLRALLDTLQDFCDGNHIPVNVRRDAQ
jgi:hypothetical protein